MGGLPVARWTITLNHPPPPSSLPYSSISPRSGPTPLRWPEGRPAPLLGLLPCLQSACAAMALGLLQCDNLCLLRYALPWWIHLVTTWHSLLGIQVLFLQQRLGRTLWGTVFWLSERPCSPPSPFTSSLLLQHRQNVLTSQKTLAYLLLWWQEWDSSPQQDLCGKKPCLVFKNGRAFCFKTNWNAGG